MIKLRPHHGLCIHFFEEKGYSREFTAHMKKIIEQLTKETLVRLVVCEDEICAGCPNALQDGCSSAGKVTRYDEAVLETIRASVDEVMSYGEFETKIEQKLIKNGKMAEICADCSWAAICHRQNRG